MEIPNLQLRDGNKIPLLAFGTGTAWFKEDGDTSFNHDLVQLIKTAIQKGFIHLDCAEMYENEEEVGVAIKEAGVPREKLFITNKVAQGIDDIHAAVTQSLEKLQTDYFDLYLIHCPFFAESDADLQRAWKAVEEIKIAGKAKSIGVSNYLRPDLEATLRGASDPPVINQIEYHPYLQRADGYVPWMRENNIQVGSFKGLTPAFRVPDGPLKAPLGRIATAHGTTENVVLLAWLVQSDIVAVTTTQKAERLDEYAQALEVKLTPEELQEISDVGATYHFRNSWGVHFADDDRS
ncbi:NADP-dependent oxidoreductase domain-containing protein [Aspergillus cavernicola]|uniref:D-xylose reductase [NAD(P)H] n=1 Tax=Aspergillus cavernicola TaxID=176166 RepID=A0ABR4IYF2_9EURO